MNVITGKANQIDEQKYQRKTEVGFSFLLEIQAKTEQDRNGNPTKIEDSGKDVRYRPVVCSEVFARSNQKTISITPKRDFSR